MELFRASTFLRRVLIADAVTCAVTGLLLVMGYEQIERLLGLPSGLPLYAGISLLPFAAFLVYLATRENLSQRMVWAVIILNVLWTVDSLLILLIGWAAPTELGYAFVIVQALGVAIFAALEYVGIRGQWSGIRGQS